MGFGLPAAIGAQLGCPERIVVNIAGDGSIQMNFQELVVAVEHDLPVKVVVLNNAHLGMVRQWQHMFYSNEYSATSLSQRGRSRVERINDAGRHEGYLPDFVKMAEAHGATGIRVKTSAGVVPALKKALATAGPVLVECMVKPDEDVYPMVPPGAAISDMLHGPILV